MLKVVRRLSVTTVLSSVSTSSHTWPRIVGEAAALPQHPRRHEECGSTKPAPLADELSL